MMTDPDIHLPPRLLRVCTILQDFPGATSRDLADLAQIPLKTAQDVLPRLKSLGLVHASGWELLGGRWSARYTAGPGENVSSLKLSPEERKLRHRKAVKVSKEHGSSKGKRRPKKRNNPIITSGPWAGLGA